jgi:hypothetical protein
LQKSSDSERDVKKKKAVKLVVSNDGAHISLRGKVWGEVKTMALGEVEENKHRSKQRPNQEVKLVNITYFSRMIDSDTFIELITGELDRRGFFDAELVAAIQDGAEWIQSLITAIRAEIIRILDFYHAGQYLSDIALLVGQAGRQLTEKWKEEQLHELKHCGPTKVLDEVKRLLKNNPRIEELTKKVNYLQKREEMMGVTTISAKRMAYWEWKRGKCKRRSRTSPSQRSRNALGTQQCESYARFALWCL